MLSRILSTTFLLPVFAHAAVVLSVDVNDGVDSPTDTAAGYAAYSLSDETLTVNGYTVDINPTFGVLLDDVHRATPVNGGSLTLGALFRDSVFAAGDNTANFYRVGLDAVIGGLTPGKKYTLTAWSFDSGSPGARVSDWSVLGMGGPIFAANEYTFNGSTPPTTDTANRFTVTAYADSGGALTLRGRPASQSATAQVFLNGFTVDELPGNAVTPSTIVALDFNARGSGGAASTQAGFTEFLMNGAGASASATARAIGAQTVTVTPVGGTMDDRRRLVPVDSGAFTESQLLRDFIFASSGATGLDVRVQGLVAGTTYLVEVWSHDNGSQTTVRTSDWTVNSSPLWDDYGFNGANTPATNNDCKMAGTFVADGAGELLISGRNVANSPNVFLNAIRVSTLAAPVIVDFGHPIISEFMAENSSGITDEDGETSDWIEIWNTTASTLNLVGWRLTDDPSLPAKWTFPAGVTVPSQGFLRVWASGKNRAVSAAMLHTNFALDKTAGGYLALRQPGGAVATEFTTLPGQRANVSYGLYGTTEPQTPGYFSPSTPLAQNTAPPVPGFVADTVFDINRGFYTTAQTVHITCATPGSTIYYTTNGSEPTTSSSVVPAGGIPVTTTTVMRAKAFAPPLAPSNTDTQTYIFNAHVQNQSAAPAGWPADWGFSSDAGATVPSDYEMDPNVVGSTLAGYGVTDAMNSLSALSVVMPLTDFLSAGAGIYQNPLNVGDAWERACSLELLELDGSGFHTNCGIRVHGNASRRPARMQKHSFRLAFRSTYGDGKLDYKLFDDTTVKQFDKLVLHAFFTDGWGLVSWTESRYRPHTALSFRGGFVKNSFADMGHSRVSGRDVHLFINGLYWGIYRIGERVDEVWASDHFGGLEVDWDIIAPGDAPIARSGTSAGWDSLFALVNSADLTQQANYDAVAAQVDLPNFVDYYLLHVHGDSEDWPHHNGYAIRNRVVPGTKWQFITWDQELAFDPLVLVDRLSPNAPNTTTDATPGRLYQRLRVNSEFRLLFADRAHKHLHNGGALSLAVEQARWQSFADKLDKAIVAESARWGDTADATPYGNSILPANATLKRETHWLQQVAAVKNSHFPGLHNTSNNYSTITELRAQSLYPVTEAPNFSQFGGNVPGNFALTITAPSAGSSTYYTVNGSDPRTPFTGAIAGTLYTTPVILTQTVTVKARARSAGGEWSALTEATFIVGTAASSANLAVTELNYNPVVADEEFIELMNIGAGVIDLTDVYFEGITFEFPTGFLLTPGQRAVVVRDQAVFTARYGGGVNIAGVYTGALDNTGEEIAVIAANDADIVRFSYNDKAPWPPAADGVGRSLVLRRPAIANNNSLHLNDAANWRSSTANGGNPGTGDGIAYSGTPLADGDGDGVVSLLEYLRAGSETTPNDVAGPVPAIEILSVAGVPQQFLTITTPVRPGADDAALTAEFSSNLSQPWQAATYVGETIGLGGVVSRKWRAPIVFTGGGQFLRLKGMLP